MIETLLIVLPLFLIIFGAAFLPKLGIADKSWGKVLNDFALKIGFPALIFSAISNVEFSLTVSGDVIVGNSIFVVSSFLLIYIFGKVFKLRKEMFNTLFLCGALGNVAYLGIPILTELYGDTVLAEASIIVAVYLFWIFTLGIGFLEYRKSDAGKGVFKKIVVKLIKNPLLLAVVFGIIFSVLNIDLPGVIDKSILMLAGSVTPLVLVVIGLFLSNTDLSFSKKWLQVFVFSLFSLMIVPAAFYFVVKAGGYDLDLFKASIIDAAMPLAITPFALAGEYDLDEDFIARSIVLSTVLSVVTLPFWMSVL